jgi:hypothetical protein
MNSCRRTTQSLCRLTATSRSFSSVHTPTGHRFPDGIYRRPHIPAPTKPISENSDMVFFDGQASQLAVDYDPLVTGKQAFKGIVVSIFLTLTIGLGVATVIRQEPLTVPNEFPYNNLKGALGGPSDLAIQERQARHKKFYEEHPL